MGKRKTSKGKFNHLAIDLMLWVIGTTECGNHDSFDLYRQVLLWVHRPEPIWIIEVILAVFTFSKALLFIFISKVSWFCFVHLLYVACYFFLIVSPWIQVPVYCKPTFIRVREISARFVRAWLSQIFLVASLSGCNNNTEVILKNCRSEAVFLRQIAK